MLAGQAYYFYLPFKKGGETIAAFDQATAILEAAKKLKLRGRMGVMITYSANTAQTQHYHESYHHGYKTSELDSNIVEGANQAEVMGALRKLLSGTYQKGASPRYEDLENFVMIAPVTTMIHNSGRPTFEGGSHLAQVQRDLSWIETKKAEGWDLFLWVNTAEERKKSGPRVAIGGGMAGPLPRDVDGEIQRRLLGLVTEKSRWIDAFSEEAAAPSGRAQGAAAGGAFVEERDLVIMDTRGSQSGWGLSCLCCCFGREREDEDEEVVYHIPDA